MLLGADMRCRNADVHSMSAHVHSNDADVHSVSADVCSVGAACELRGATLDPTEQLEFEPNGTAVLKRRRSSSC